MTQVASKYYIRNWAEYNKALIQRGSITLWFEQDYIDQWVSTFRSGSKGRPQIYSDDAILCMLLLKITYNLPLRALHGFVTSLIQSRGLNIPTPSYTQVCRRAKKLGKALKKLSSKRPTDIVFDSTGLKVYGEGEWKVRQHGASKRRVWKKLHIGIDPKSQEIIVAELTTNGIGAGDAETAEKLIKRISKNITRVFGDGGYDGINFRKAAEQLGAEVIVPPPRGAIVHSDAIEPALIKRNLAICEIKGLGGDDGARALWKKLKGYHIRSLVETAMYRIKQLTGCVLKSRTFETQQVEAYVKCLVVNKMTRLGMPVGEWVKVA